MKRQIKDNIYSSIAVITKALSSPKRIEVLDLLSQGDKSVEEIAEQADLGIKNASAQLKELKSARLLDSRKNGKYVYYFLADKSIAHFLIQLRSLSENRSIELQKITQEALSSHVDLVGVDRKSLMNKARKGEVILIDVRPSEEFHHGHLPFAQSVPLSELKKSLKSLPKEKEIIAYCRGPYCFYAKEAVEMLRSKGFNARRLKDSIYDWENHGLPIEKTA
ncbi:MAG: ArsR/SmtB family transcription factor [Pseudobdellovibrionaceae bacterium]